MKTQASLHTFVFAMLMLLGATYIEARELPDIDVTRDNESVREALIEVFTEAGKPEFVKIAKCESNLTHYKNGKLKKNPTSNARGILQVMTSGHPEPAWINRYNRRYGTKYSVSDFDLNDPEEYLQYSLLLAVVRGTRDWNASKHCWG